MPKLRKKGDPIPYKEFVAKPRSIRARLLEDNETVKCYNGLRIGMKGDYVVIDEYDRVMVMRSDRFHHTYTENQHEQAQL